MHLTFQEDIGYTSFGNQWRFSTDIDLDAVFFYSVPSSSFSLDSKIPEILRSLIVEAESCLKMNFLTGASACTRKAIYELTILEKADGEGYEEKIKFLKKKFTSVPEDYFDVLCHIKDMTSDKIHEQSWDEWDSKHLRLFLATLREILREIYIVPENRKNGVKAVRELLSTVKQAKAKTG